MFPQKCGITEAAIMQLIYILGVMVVLFIALNYIILKRVDRNCKNGIHKPHVFEEKMICYYCGKALE